MRIEFTLRKLAGLIEVTLEENSEPEQLGCLTQAKGFPVCTATVDYAGRGYDAAFGWIQLVRSSDNASSGARFELDPFEPLGRQTHPFCFFGFMPTLFDAPARPAHEPIDWTAHSFLCFVAGDARQREARALSGFSWGFAVRADGIAQQQPARLHAGDWDGHLPLLAREYPTWKFNHGYQGE